MVMTVKQFYGTNVLINDYIEAVERYRHYFYLYPSADCLAIYDCGLTFKHTINKFEDRELFNQIKELTLEYLLNKVRRLEKQLEEKGIEIEDEWRIGR